MFEDPPLEARRRLFRDGLLIRVVLGAVFALVAAVFGLAGLAPPSSAVPAILILGLLVLINVPYWMVGARAGFPLRHFSFHWAVDIVFLTLMIHFIGGIDAPYATLAYSALVLFAAVSESRRVSIRLAVLSMMSFGVLVALETSGIVPRVDDVWDHHFSPAAQAVSFLVSVVFVFALAFVGGTLADQLKQSLAELRSASECVEEQNRELEQRVAARTAELAAATQEIADLVHIMSHDLKNVAVGATETARQLAIRESGRLSERGKEYTRHLLDDSRELSGMLEDLLRLFRATDTEAGGREWVDVEEVVRGVLRRLRPQIERKAIEIVVGPLPAVFAETGKIRHIFDNLIDNACKYVGEARPPRIEVGGESRDGRVEYFVRDNGIGISAGQRERVFQLYHRAPGQETGHGVGLAIVKRIVERYGGTIELDSELGRGSTFRVRLPLRPEAAA